MAGPDKPSPATRSGTPTRDEDSDVPMPDAQPVPVNEGANRASIFGNLTSGPQAVNADVQTPPGSSGESSTQSSSSGAAYSDEGSPSPLNRSILALQNRAVRVQQQKRQQELQKRERPSAFLLRQAVNHTPSGKSGDKSGDNTHGPAPAPAPAQAQAQAPATPRPLTVADTNPPSSLFRQSVLAGELPVPETPPRLTNPQSEVPKRRRSDRISILSLAETGKKKKTRRSSDLFGLSTRTRTREGSAAPEEPQPLGRTPPSLKNQKKKDDEEDYDMGLDKNKENKK
ncbi:hypothetical protein GGR54DRAFT_638947 [Hypoxylon sp. NC1633]|nr:hypothetical protein GGR54DRAFT_638947 [Hypoxylon sp. NC1633]